MYDSMSGLHSYHTKSYYIKHTFLNGGEVITYSVEVPTQRVFNFGQPDSYAWPVEFLLLAYIGIS